MSAPVSHIIFGNIILKKLTKIEDPCSFYIGVCFPDIRYLGVIDKEKTHYKITKFCELNVVSGFDSGVKCHVLVDTLRTSFMKESNIYSLIPDSKYSKIALKFYEDQLRLNNFSNKEVAGFLDTFTKEEHSFGISEESLRKWHSIIKTYLLSQLDQNDIKRLTDNFILGEEISSEIAKLISIMSKEEKIKIIINSFYDNFEEILNNYIKDNK